MSAGSSALPGKPEEAEVRRIFAGIAGHYDRFNAVSSFGRDRAWRKQAVQLAGIKRSSHVLDLAAGTGDLAMAIASKGAPSTLLVTDLVPEMLQMAKEKFASFAGPTSVSFDLADAQALPYAAESFDVVTVGFGVRNMPDRGANFREVYRVLKPGGRYVVLEFSRPMNSVFRQVYYSYLRTVIPQLGGLLTKDRKAFEYLKDSILGFPGQHALAGELYKAGFREVTWKDLTFGVVAVHVAIK